MKNNDRTPRVRLLAWAALAAVALLPRGAAAQANPVPLVEQPLAPASALPGSAALTLTVNGTGFVSGSVVDWNSSPRLTTFVSGSQLNAAILASDLAAEGTGLVTVVDPAPGGGVSNTAFFDVALPSAAVFFGRADYSTGVAPEGAVAADFNGDGKLDLATPNLCGSDPHCLSNTGTVSVLLGNGDGTFQAHVDYPVGSHPGALVAADFNGDGRLDLAVLNSDDSTVSILLGNGDGTFQAQTVFPAGGTSGLAAADFNADGKVDLAVTNGGSNTVSVLLGNGDGTLQAPVSYATGAGPGCLTVADFNRDGSPDLAVADVASQAVSILLGNGDGTFQPHVDTAVNSFVECLAAADFNGDGKPDLAVSSVLNGVGSVAILLGNGDGTFGPASNYATGNNNSIYVITGDFNGDGKLDVATDGGPTGVAILLGNGDGTFHDRHSYGTGESPAGMAAGDFNQDGRLDLAVPSAGFRNSQSVVSVLLQSTVSLFPPVLHFAAQDVGVTSPPKTITLTNVGAAAVDLSGMALGGPDPGDFAETGTTRGASVAPGASCAITLTFTPSVANTRTATLSVTDDAVGSPQVAHLEGAGVEPFVTLSPTGLEFFSQLVGTRSAAQQVTLTNGGDGALNISSLTVSAGFLERNGCGSIVLPKRSCVIAVSFEPVTKGVTNGAVTITDNATGSPQTISLYGTATVVTLSPTGLDFGSVPVGTTAGPLTAILTNHAGQPLTILKVGILGTDPGDFAETNTCGTSLGPGASCTISVTFTPTAVGSRSAAVLINDNGGGAYHFSQQSVGLAGTGT